ncbi:MAG TPA: hypothetical protein VL362_00625, partial [Patescibacteria group bacterium]|nr:hypothetical protein [Patescibacteria group bacterium]
KLSVDQPYHVYADGAPSQRSADLVSASLKQLTKRRLLIACDDSFSNETLDMFATRADRVTVAKGEEINGRYHADDLAQAVELTCRSAKKDDIVLLVGPHFTAESDTNSIQAEHIIKEVLHA